MSRVVVKVGGAVAGHSAAAVHELADAGNQVCVVHGAGPQISEHMVELGIPVEFVGGRRVTTEAGIAVVRDSFAEVNARLCSDLGSKAVGLFGDAIGIEALQVPALGLVGDPLPSRPPAVESALVEGLIPVVAPLAVGPLNVNADEAAAALAVGLEAERLLFLTDVPGLILHGAVVPHIAPDEADRLLEEDVLQGGILPKLRAAVVAARLGVRAEIGETAVRT